MKKVVYDEVTDTLYVSFRRAAKYSTTETWGDDQIWSFSETGALTDLKITNFLKNLVHERRIRLKEKDDLDEAAYGWGGQDV